MEVAAAGRPDAAPGAASLGLGAVEAGEAVEMLAVEAVDLGPASAKLGEFKLMPSNKGVGENPAVAIFRIGYRVSAKDDARAVRRERVHGIGGSLGAALDRGAGSSALGAVDADKPDVGETAGRQPDAQRVAVDGVDDDGASGAPAAALLGLAGLAASHPGEDRETEENGGELHDAILTPSPAAILAGPFQRSRSGANLSS
jgi:hypothetical protein